MAVPMTLGSAADLIDLSIQKIYKKLPHAALGEAAKLYHEEQTDDYYDKDSGLSGFGEAGRMTENVIISSESPIQTFDKTYTQVFHGKMAQFTLYDWKFGIKKRKLESITADLVGSLKRKQERILTEYLENSIADATSYTVTDETGNWTKSVTGGDSVGFIDSSHTREDGGTAWSNVVSDGTTSNMDWEYDALKAALRTASLITDPKGNLYGTDIDTFVFRKQSAIYFRAQEILGAVRKGDVPASAENDGSGVPAFKVVGLPYMLNANAAYWWGFDTKLMGPEMGLQLRTSQGLTLDKPETDYKTKSIYVSSTMAFDYGHNDGRLAVGSTGVNA